MEEIIKEILGRLRAGETVDDRVLVKLVHAAARRAGTDKRAVAKRRLWPFYQRVKREEPERWRSWGVAPELERALATVLRMKPRRSASGVATITVITKPWPCSGSCVFCPNDVRCPKSYLADEPACARAVQNAFDPYLQVSARLTALAQMGHATDKIELIVLGGTWSDYPEAYRIWFVTELFRALNDDAVAGAAANPALRGFPVRAGQESRPPQDEVPAGVRTRRARYERAGLMGAPDPAREERIAAAQCAVAAGELTYNQAVAQLAAADEATRPIAAAQRATWDELEREQRRNEAARHRVVGLVVETRPDAITPTALASIRRLGATKVQMGVQSVDQRVLDENGRNIAVGQIARAFDLLRLFGFKIHAHFMVNLLGATPAADKRDYERFASDPAFLPDEVKLYPCALIEGAALCRCYERGTWRPYTEDELLDVLTADTLATPSFMRVSRMIRDFSSQDIVAGNKKPNLRQRVEERLRASGERVHEIRFREIAGAPFDPATLALDEVAYETTSTSERFLQWVTPDGRIVGFLRLSLPQAEAVRALAAELAGAGDGAGADAGIGERAPSAPALFAPGEAMIREVHVYGVATAVGEEGVSAQHHGLGRRLVERACAIARDAGYARINVISAVGTRAYYRQLGFADHGLYQQRDLSDGAPAAGCNGTEQGCPA